MIAEELRLHVAHPAALGLGYRRPLLRARALSETPPMRRCRPSPRDVVRVAGRVVCRSARVATVIASIAAARHRRRHLTQPE
eukprot:scaffold144284_cov142-Phaeocystis_antarctica.AAC.1